MIKSYHVDLALQKAVEAEQSGDRERADKFYRIAEKYEQFLAMKGGHQYEKSTISKTI